MQAGVYFTTMGLERVVGIGVDIIEVERIARDLQDCPGTFEETFCSPQEIALGESLDSTLRPSFYANHFSAKEAIIKALGGGGDKGNEIELDWREIDLGSDGCVNLSGRARQRAKEIGAKHLALSFRTEKDIPLAVCIAYGR